MRTAVTIIFVILINLSEESTVVQAAVRNARQIFIIIRLLTFSLSEQRRYFPEGRDSGGRILGVKSRL
jgi:hypothetical protein